MKQQNLFIIKSKNDFGGSLLQGKRREIRPLDSKKPTHLVLKAANSLKLLQNADRAEEILRKYAKRLGVKVYELAVQADHIHVAIRTVSRRAYNSWIRAVTSVLVQRIQGLKWKFRPYTRIATWGRGFARVRAYVRKNAAESRFVVAAEKRVSEYKARVDLFFEKHIGPFFTQ